MAFNAADARLLMAAAFSIVLLVTGCSPSPRQVKEAAGEEFRVSSREMMEWIETIVGFGDRLPGQPGLEKTRYFIVDKLGEFGVSNVILDPVNIEKWAPQKAELRFLSKGKIIDVPCQWMSLSPGTSPAGLRTPAVYVGDGSRIELYDLAGKAVVYQQRMGNFPAGKMKSLFYDPDDTIDKDLTLTSIASLKFRDHIWETCKEKKAAALIGLLVDFPYETDTFYMQPEPGGERPPLPGVWVSRERSREVVDLLKDDSTVLASIVNPVDEGVYEDYNVVAIIHGKSPRYFVVHTHYDSGFNGAVQDASGVAEVLALAKHLTLPETEPMDHGLIFLFTAAHMHGRLGARDFVTDYKDYLDLIDLDFTIEHVGLDCEDAGGNKGLVCSDLPAPRFILTSSDWGLIRTIRAAAEENDLKRCAVVPHKALIVMSDEKYARGDGGENYAAGVPCAGYISAPPYFMSREDAPDKVAKDELKRVAKTVLTTFRLLDK